MLEITTTSSQLQLNQVLLSRPGSLFKAMFKYAKTSFRMSSSPISSASRPADGQNISLNLSEACQPRTTGIGKSDHLLPDEGVRRAAIFLV